MGLDVEFFSFILIFQMNQSQEETTKIWNKVWSNIYLDHMNDAKKKIWEAEEELEGLPWWRLWKRWKLILAIENAHDEYEEWDREYQKLWN